MSLNFESSLVFDKGLSNYFGHNNCFLNSAVQVLWHLDVFRQNFLALKQHYCIKGTCIYCSLQDIFKEFNDSEEDVLHPDMLRVTLATTFQEQLKFQLGELEDASECYENILSRIHFHLCHGMQEDCCSLEHCLTHKKFAMSLIQQSKCKCGSTSEPLSYNQLVHFVSSSSVVKIYKENKSKNFGEVLKSAFNSGLVSGPCSPGCDLTSRVTHTLVNLPDVVSIGLIWESGQPDPVHIREFVSAIGTSIKLEDLFDKVVESNGTNPLELVGVVCYYMKHYSTFFFHSKKKIWISFDDASVTEIGKDWSKVINKCYKGKYQPLLLIYQNSQAGLIDIKTAPFKTTYITDGYEGHAPLRNKSNNSATVSLDSICEAAILNSNDSNRSTMDKQPSYHPFFQLSLYSNPKMENQKQQNDCDVDKDNIDMNYLKNNSSAICKESEFKSDLKSKDSNISSWTILDVCEQNNNSLINNTSPTYDNLISFEWPSDDNVTLHKPTQNSSQFSADDLENITHKKFLRDKVRAIYR